MKKVITLKKLFAIFIVLMCSYSSKAQWEGSPILNNPICTASNSQSNVQMTTDGKGGTIMVWEDIRTGKSLVYAQRIDVYGNIKWTANGNRLTLSDSVQTAPKIVADDKGGAYIAWVQMGASNTTDIWGSHIDSTGAELWTGGRAICTAAGNQNEVAIAATGSGITNGVVVVWTDSRNFSTAGYDIYIHRLTYSGNLNVAQDGKLVTTSNQTQSQISPQIIATGNSTWIAYKNYMGNAIAGFDIYASYFDINVNQSYSIDVSQQQGNEDHQKLASDGANGVVIVWDLATATASGQNIYAQRVSIAGTTQWTAGGITVCNATGVQANPEIIADGFGNAIMVWTDGRNVLYPILYTQRFNSAGVAKWTANGKAVGSPAVNSQQDVSIVANGKGGAVYVFYDSRFASINGGYHDVFAQQLDSLGAAIWGAEGTFVTTAAFQQDMAKVVPSSNGGYIVAWNDTRNGNSDIYASKLNASGTLPLQLVSFSAQGQDKSIVLYWATTNEINTSHFEIEYSNNGAAFSYAGKETAKGNTENKYAFNYALKDNGTAYFRLKMIDKDGRFTYSGIIKVDVVSKNSFSVDLYPTVVKNAATITIHTTTNETVNITITNMAGHRVKSFAMPINFGWNNIAIDASGFINGNYILSVQKKDGTIFNTRFIKQ